MKNIFITLIGLIISATSFSQSSLYKETLDSTKWTAVTKDNEGDIFFIKTENIYTDIEYNVKVWVNEIQPYFSVNGKKYKNIVTTYLYLFDCQNRTMSVLNVATYSYNGTLIKSHQFNQYDIQAQDVIPGTVGEFLLNKACELFNTQR